jgi:hypothetical protein
MTLEEDPELPVVGGRSQAAEQDWLARADADGGHIAGDEFLRVGLAWPPTPAGTAELLVPL